MTPGTWISVQSLLLPINLALAAFSLVVYACSLRLHAAVRRMLAERPRAEAGDVLLRPGQSFTLEPGESRPFVVDPARFLVHDRREPPK